MARRRPAHGVLVLVELGAEWPDWVQGVVRAGARRVVSQEVGEAPDAFADRVAELVSELEARGVPLSIATIACNERRDAVAMSARSKLAQAVCGAIFGRRDGRLFLAVSGPAHRACGELAELARELRESFGLERNRVGVRSGEAVPLAGERARVA